MAIPVVLLLSFPPPPNKDRNKYLKIYIKRSQLAEKNQLAIYNRDQEAELGTIKNKLS